MRGSGEWRRNVWRFLVHNQRLLWLLGVLLLGVEIGCLVFRASPRPLATALDGLLTPTPPPTGFAGVMGLVTAACFPTFLLLLLLFVAGLSACGAPLALSVLLFFGMGLGLTEAYYFAQGGWGVGYVALLVLPHTLVTVVGLIMAVAESVRLSTRLCRQVLPGQSLGGGLWPDFRLYLARFLLCAGLLFAAGVLETVLYLCFCSHFV